MTPTAETPRTHEFQFATTYGFGGFEIALVAKTMTDLRTAWGLIAAKEIPLDERKINTVRIKRA